MPHGGLKGHNRTRELLLRVSIRSSDGGHQVVLLVLRKIQNVELNKTGHDNIIIISYEVLTLCQSLCYIKTSSLLMTHEQSRGFSLSS